YVPVFIDRRGGVELLMHGDETSSAPAREISAGEDLCTRLKSDQGPVSGQSARPHVDRVTLLACEVVRRDVERAEDVRIEQDRLMRARHSEADRLEERLRFVFAQPRDTARPRTRGLRKNALQRDDVTGPDRTRDGSCGFNHGLVNLAESPLRIPLGRSHY